MNNLSFNAYNPIHRFNVLTNVQICHAQQNTSNKIVSQDRLCNITPEMIGVNLHSVSFRGNAGFEKRDLVEIQNLLNACTYGKKDLLQNPDRLKPKVDDDGIHLSGFHNPSKSELSGNCEELTYKTGKLLQERFKDKYIFFPVRGFCSAYQMFHFFLIGCKNNEANINNLAEVYEKFKEFEDGIDDNLVLDDEFYRKPFLEKEIFKNSILIDSSFNYLKVNPGMADYNAYNPQLLYDLSCWNPIKEEVLSNQKNIQVPLGFVCEIAPELRNYKPDDLICLQILAEDGLRFRIVAGQKNTRAARNVDIDSLPQKHLLRQFYNVIKNMEY